MTARAILTLCLLTAGATSTPALAQTIAPPAAQASAPAPSEPGEPLPSGAPTAPYELTAWCYGALGEYLHIYQIVKPDLRDIDRMFGSSVKNEQEPYADDMTAARHELKILAGAVEAAEKASPTPIAPRGADAIKHGEAIWSPAETKTHRELARAWLSWALPDRCDSVARTLAANSRLLGQALKYNAPPPEDTPPSPAPPPPTDAAPPAPEATPAPASDAPVAHDTPIAPPPGPKPASPDAPKTGPTP
jgi:hypothetical protein